ncbi:MAG TPA: hypothetical protein VLK37_12485 [Solirubrobacterales bacterium]|nr:hypothetical protein [Solirubrobacterales bacterium]
MLLVGLVVIATISLISSGAAQEADDLLPPELNFSLHTHLERQQIPARKPVPIALHMGGKIWNRDHTGTPGLREVQFEGDRHAEIDVVGRPTCGARDLPASPPPWRRCADAIVGRGHATVISAFPENTPMTIDLGITVFNSGVSGGITRLSAYAYMPVIEPGPILVPIKISRVKNGRYGWRALASVPIIFGGSSYITSVDLTLRKDIFSVACPGESLQATTRSVFSDGTVIGSTSIQKCR